MADAIVSQVNLSSTANDSPKQELQSTTKSGTPPRRRLATAEAAYNVFANLKDNYYLVSESRAKIQGMYDGNPPYNMSELERLGQSYRCNVNFREMESIIDTNVSAAWSLHMDVGTLIDVRFAPKHAKNDGTTTDWANIIAAEYTRTLLNWPGFYSNLNLSLHEYFLFGIGCAAWPDEWDWRSRAFKAGNLLVPGLTSTDPDKIDIIFIRDRMALGDLYREIEDRDMAEKKGWNVAGIKKLLVRKYIGNAQTGYEDQDAAQTSVWESLQEKLKAGDPEASNKEYEGIEIVHILVKELYDDKKISHFIIPEDVQLKEIWLYQGYQKYDSMTNAVWLLPYSYGDGYLRTSKGLGHRSFPHCEFSNRFLCTTFDGGVLAASLLVQPKTGLDAARMSLIRMGPVTLLPESLSVIQSSFLPNVSSLVQLRGLSKDILHNNTGVFRPRDEQINERIAPKTARQVMSEENKEARFERNQIEHFYVHWQLWHKETFRRLTNKEYVEASIAYPGQEAAKEFIQRCVDQGVPKKLLLDPEAMEVYVARAIGMGSPSVKMDITNQLQAMKGSMDELGRKEADREWGAVRVGYWNVDRFFPKSTRDNIPSNSQSFAVLENNDFVEGKVVPVGSDQQHVTHITVHFARIDMLIRATQAGQVDPVSAVQELTIILPHASAHVQYLSLDSTRKDQVTRAIDLLNAYNKVFVQLQKVAKQMIDQQAQEMADQEGQQAQEAPMDPETQVKMAEIQKDLQLEGMKQQSLNEMRMFKSKEQLQIRAQQAQADALLKSQVVSADIERKNQLMQAQIDSLRQKSAATP